jgi:hypothetical protein
MTFAIGAGLLAGDAANGTVNAAGFEILRPHRAIYEIELKEATERSGIATMNGRIVYEMNGNECDGMSVRYRFVSRVNANGEIFTTDQQTASFESPDGSQYTFLTKSYVNEALDRTVKGVAEQTGSGLQVKLDSPEKRELELKGASFISTHLVKMIEEARDGTAFFKLNVFDGGDGADEVLKTTNVIGGPDIVDEVFDGEKAEAVAGLKNETSWPVTIGYFDNLITDSTEGMPVYQVSFLLYEGGISRKLTMSYPDYSITGSLVSLELLEQEACTLNN